MTYQVCGNQRVVSSYDLANLPELVRRFLNALHVFLKYGWSSFPASSDSDLVLLTALRFHLLTWKQHKASNPGEIRTFAEVIACVEQDQQKYSSKNVALGVLTVAKIGFTINRLKSMRGMQL